MALKIALIHYRLLQAGGLENRILNYSRWFMRHGCETHLITCKYDPDFPLPKGVQVHILKKLPLPKVFNMWAFDRSLGKFMQSHRFEFSLAMGRTSHQDAVLAPGNHLGFLRAQGRTASSLSDRMQIYMDHKGHDHSKIIFAASEMMRRELIELYGVNAEKVHVLYPPLDTERYQPISPEEKAQARKAANIAAGTKVLAFVSGSHQRKGMDLLLNLMRDIPPKKTLLLIAGAKPPGNLPENVRAMGFVKDMREVYKLADFLVHPAVYEPYGQIVAEALASGVPVLVSDRCGAAEIVDAHSGVVLPWNDVAAWRAAIENADAGRFDIPADFAEEKGLTTDHHLRRMLSLSGISL